MQPLNLNLKSILIKLYRSAVIQFEEVLFKISGIYAKYEK